MGCEVVGGGRGRGQAVVSMCGCNEEVQSLGTCRCITPRICGPPSPPGPADGMRGMIRCAVLHGARSMLLLSAPARSQLDASSGHACPASLACLAPLPCVHSLSIEVRGPSRDLHSGNEGGVFTEPLADLSKVGRLAEMLCREKLCMLKLPHSHTMLPAWRVICRSKLPQPFCSSLSASPHPHLP